MMHALVTGSLLSINWLSWTFLVVPENVVAVCVCKCACRKGTIPFIAGDLLPVRCNIT